ncbi:MAG: CDP-alcohol phosphatidyltransferase family protein [Acidimicrobiales bacterium]
MSVGPAEPVSDRVLTIPNLISVARLCCLPVMLWLLFGRDNRVAAAALLAVLGATDFLDGYVARRYNQVSTVGKVLDPVADRLLFIVGVGAIVIDGSVPLWFAIVVLVREVLVAGATIVLAAMGARRIDVTWWGKAGTFCLMIAFPLFLLANSTFSRPGLAEFVAWGFGLVGVVMSYYAAALYVPMAQRALAERDRPAGLDEVSRG